MKKKITLLNSFRSFITRNNLFGENSKVLVAVSGGVDSVVLLHLLNACALNVSAAHCNFQLRGKDSKKDEKFVKELCDHLNIPFFHKAFETKKFAEDNGISVQMAARDLRYSWFNSLVNENGFDAVCTAHHADDNAETLFLNLARGTGLDGLTGIDLKKGMLIRPLLFASKKQIRKFATQNDIEFRKDKSNDEEYYKRNFVRRKIIPLFRKLNPSFDETLIRSIEYFKDAAALVDHAIHDAEDSIINRNKKEIRISVPELDKFPSCSVFMHHFFKKESLPLSAIDEVLSLLESQPGKEVLIEGKRILRDRDCLIITDQKVKNGVKSAIIKKNTNAVQQPVSLMIETRTGIPEGKFDDRILYASLDKIEFPLKVRRWKAGDYIYPFGMKGKKKVSDVLIDKKISLHKKENICVLEDSQGRIIWVIGVRNDERFKVTDSTGETLIVKLTDPDYL